MLVLVIGEGRNSWWRGRCLEKEVDARSEKVCVGGWMDGFDGSG